MVLGSLAQVLENLCHSYSQMRAIESKFLLLASFGPSWWPRTQNMTEYLSYKVWQRMGKCKKPNAHSVFWNSKLLGYLPYKFSVKTGNSNFCSANFIVRQICHHFDSVIRGQRGSGSLYRNIISSKIFDRKAIWPKYHLTKSTFDRITV
jgi:hypothetical protein